MKAVQLPPAACAGRVRGCKPKTVTCAVSQPQRRAPAQQGINGAAVGHHAEPSSLHLNGSAASYAVAQEQAHLGTFGAAAAAAAPAGFGGGSQPPRLQLHYKTTWQQPVLHHSVNGGEWQGLAMEQVVSGSGWWKAADLHLDPHAVAAAASSSSSATHVNGSAAAAPPPPPLLEFVITDAAGHDVWDKAPDGGNYTIGAPGRYHLQEGLLAPATAKPLLLVSDLDDTMIGDDAATAAFSAWWRAEGVAAGGRLVYNTGRALDLFESLLAEKGQLMAEPDMLVSSLGTRIYLKDGERWREDEGYTALLGAGWQLEGVREACYRALAEVGKDAMHFRPPSEMSEHKVTCGVRLDVLTRVLASIQAYLAEAGALYRLVVSGSGDWRFVDLVPREAGKLQALEYARRTLGFLPEHTVACGDSGNDIDMLEGDHLSIVVGNAHPVLLEWAEQRRGGGELLITQAHRADGILEGLQNWGFKV